MNRLVTALITAVLTLQLGCGAIQQPSWNKPFGKGTWIPAAVCAVAGGGIGAWIQEETKACTTADRRICNQPDHWEGALIGAAVGAVACALAGHVFLDPTPTYPPVAPPPTPEPTPLPTALTWCSPT